MMEMCRASMPSRRRVSGALALESAPGQLVLTASLLALDMLYFRAVTSTGDVRSDALDAGSSGLGRFPA